MFLDELAAWHGRIDRDAAAEVLERMRFAADTYGLVIRQSDEKRTIAAISTMLALWSAGSQRGLIAMRSAVGSPS
jgi:hypothetical protein